jgi:hypothetical protein
MRHSASRNASERGVHNRMPGWVPRAEAPPPPVDTGVRLDALTRDEQLALWRWMKRHDPSQVAFWRDTPVVQRLLGEGAVPVFDREYLERAGIVVPE